ncbi:MAG: gliding motility-associated C-terminal domain-containing protein [Bacteroidales bacterium]
MFINMRSLKIKSLLAVILMVMALVGHSANRYWVNGSGSWHDTNHWSEISGGNPGASIPTKSDNVIFDNNSFTANGQQVLIKGVAECNDFRWEVENIKAELKSKSFILKNITKSEIQVYGSLFINENINNEFFGDLVLKSSNTSKIEIKTDLNSNISFNSENGNWTVLSDLKTSGDITIISGNINLNNYIIESSGFISSGNAPRKINFGKSKIITDNIDFSDSRNLDYGYSKINIEFKNKYSDKKYKLGSLPVALKKADSKAATMIIEDIIVDSVKCNGESTGSIFVSLSGGTKPYTYTLYTASPFAIVGVPVTKPDTTHTFSNLSANDYVVRIQDSGFGLDQDGPFNVGEPDQLLGGAITVAQPLSCFDGSDAELEANPTGGTTPYTYKWYKYDFDISVDAYVPIGQTTKIATGLSQGLYKVEVQDKNGCGVPLGYVNAEYALFREYDVVNVPDSIHISNISSTNTCFGSNNGTITITASGGTPTLEYYLKLGAVNIPAGSPWDNDGLFTDLSAGTYETYVIDLNSCIKRGADIVVGINMPPVVDAGSNASTCQEVAINLATVLPTPASASNYSSLLWDDGVAPGTFNDATLLHPTYTPAAGQTGTVTLTLTANGNTGCSSVNDNMTLTIIPKPIVDAGSNGTTCAGVAFDLNTASPTKATASNYSSLLWDDGSAPGTFNDATLLLPIYTPAVGQTGTVTLTLTANGNGSCLSASDFMTLTINAAPIVDAGSNASTCQEVAINLATVLPTPASASNYSSLLWDDGVAPGTFNDATLLHPTYTPAVGQTGAVTLTLTANGNTGCSSVSDNMTLTITAKPVVDAGSNASTCEGVAINLATVLPTPASASNYSSLLWDDGSAPGTFNDATLLLPTYTPAVGQTGTVTLTLTANGNGSCSSASDFMTLTINPAPIVDAGSNASTCEEVAINLATVLPTPASASNYSSLLWDDGLAPGTFDDATLLHPTYTPAVGQTGVVTLTLTANGNGGCTSVSDNMTLTIAAKPIVDAGSNASTCEGVAITLATVLPTPASASNYSSLLWDDGSAPGTFNDATLLHPTYTPAAGQTGTVTLTLTANGNGGCSSVSDNMTLTIIPKPIVDAGSNGTTCAGVAFDLNTVSPTKAAASNYSSLLWNDGVALGTFNDATLLLPIYTPALGQTGTVTLTLTANGNGSCLSASDFMTLTINAAPVVDAGSNASTCEGVAINLATVLPTPASASNYSSLLWDDGVAPGTFNDATLLHPTYTPAAGQTGTVTLTLTANGNTGCSSVNDNMTLTIIPKPIVDAGSNGTTCAGVAFDLNTASPTKATASNYSSLLWDDGSAPGTFNDATLLLPIYTPAVGQTGTVTLTLTANGNGSCLSASDFMTLTINAAPIVDAGSNASTCQEVAINLATVLPTPASASNYSSLLWDDGVAPGTFNDATLLHPTYTPAVGQTGAVTLTLTANGNTGCSSVSDNMTLTITAKPVVDAGSNASTCEGVAINLATVLPTPASASNYSSLLWDDGSAPGTFNDATLLLPTYTPAVGQTGTVTLTLTANGNGSCSSASDFMTLTINPAPIVDAGSNASTCEEVAINLATVLPTPASASNYSSLLWDDGLAPGTFDDATLLHPTYTPAVGQTGVVTLTLTANGNGGCTSVSDNMTLTIAAKPIVDAGSNASTCEGVAITLATVLPTPASASNYSSLLWDDGSAPGTFNDATLLHPTYTPAAGQTGTVTLTLTANGNGGCSSVSDNMTLTIIPAPDAYAGADTLLCYGEPYLVLDATQSNGSGFSWTSIGGDGTWINQTTISPTYTPGNGDLLKGYVDLVLTVIGNSPCANTTDTIRINYLPELRAAIGKPSPYLIDSTSTHISVYVKISGHRYIGNLGIFLVSPLDSVVELKSYCTAPLPPNRQDATFVFYNDPLDTSAIVPINTCTAPTGRYQFSGVWKKKLHDQDPANGSWRIRIGNNRNWGQNGLIEEATITFSDFNKENIFESILYADSSVNLNINPFTGGIPSITEFALPITGITTSCFDVCDGTAIVTASGGQPPYVSYEWSTDLGFTNIIATTDTVKTLCVGDYYVRVTDSHGCTAIDSVTVGAPPEIKITGSTVVNNVCFGDSIGAVTLTFAGGTGDLTYTYDTYTGAPKNSGETFDELKAGVYTFTITDISGCTKDTIITITQGLEITATYTITPVICNGGSDGEIEIIASGGLPPYNYSITEIPEWSNTTGIFTGLTGDSVYIAVRDANLCILYSDTIEIGEPDPISIDLIEAIPVSCIGGGLDGEIIITASGGTGTLLYSLDNVNFQASNIFTGLIIGTYSIYVSDDCDTVSAIDAATITGPIPIVIDVVTITDVNTCFGDNTGTITLTASGGTGNFEYSIDGGANYQVSNLFTALYAGPYVLVVRDDDGCTSPDSTVNVSQPEQLVIVDYIVTHTSECNNPVATGRIEIVTVNGGTPGYLYGLTGFALQASPIFTDLAVGDYTITIQDANGCETTLDTAIVLNPAMTIDLEKIDISCNGLTDGSISIVITNGTPGYTYLWSNGETTPVINDLTSGTYSVTVTDSNLPNNCIANTSIDIVEPQALTLAINSQGKLCVNSTARDIILANGRINADPSGGTPGYLYSWTGPNGFTAVSDYITNLEIGTYNLTVTDTMGCTKDTLVIIGADESFDITSSYVLDRDTLCSYTGGINFEVTTTSVDSIFWQLLEDDFIPPIVETRIETSPQIIHFDPLISTDYRMTLVNEFCIDEYPSGSEPKILVHVKQGVGLSILDDDEPDDDTVDVKITQSKYTLKGMVQNITVNATYIWTPATGLQNPNVLETDLTPDVARWYYLSALTEDGCAELDSIFINFIPNVVASGGFSPNGDGINDYWNIEGIDDFPNNLVEVYTRWGIKVFSQRGYSNLDPNKQWDGRAGNGNDLPTGTYYYIVITNEGGYQPITGPVTIVR